MAMKRLRSTRKRRIAAGVALVIVLLLGGLYSLLTTATPVSREAAIEAFRQDQAAAYPSALDGGTVAEAGAEVDAAGGGAPEGAGTQAGAGSGAASAALTVDPASGMLDRPLLFRAPSGVYTYLTTGGESMSGHEFRDFPDETYRNVIHTGPETWTDHHFFLEERQIWTEFQRGDDGRFVKETRNKLAFGPGSMAVINSTVTFTPYMRSTALPWHEGRRWEGEFQGETYGKYRGSTLEATTVKVGGGDVDVWVDQLDFELHGELEGAVTVRRWISPRHGLTIRETYNAAVRNGPLVYSAKWTVHLKSLRAAR